MYARMCVHVCMRVIADIFVAVVVFSTLFLMFVISVVYYPAFASIRAPIPLLGYVVGFVDMILL